MGTRNEYLLELARLKSIMDNQDKIMEELKDVRREQILLRKGHEAFDWEAEVEDNEDVDLDDVPHNSVEDD